MCEAAMVMTTTGRCRIAEYRTYESDGRYAARAQRWMANCSQSAHGIGTARAMQMDYTMGTYAGLSMGLVAVINTIMVPQIWAFMAPVLLSAEP